MKVSNGFAFPSHFSFTTVTYFVRVPQCGISLSYSLKEYTALKWLHIFKHYILLKIQEQNKIKLVKLKSSTGFHRTLGIGNKLLNYDLSSAVYLSLIMLFFSYMLSIVSTRS